MSGARKWLALGGGVALASVVLVITAVLLLQPRAIALQQGSPPASSPELVARGAYLARAADCTACHTAPGGKPFAGGLQMQTPFGTIISTNITPDRETGIGGWTTEAFARALRKGIATDGYLLYPAMPYNAYTQVSDDDIGALKAYFDTVEPVRNVVEGNRLPFPFNIREMMLGWNLLFFRDARFAPEPQQSPEWNRGRYLVDGLGHCAACHTAKNILGGDKAYLQGGVLQGWYAPELSGNSYVGLGTWSRDDLVAYLKTGANTRAVAAGPMAEAVEHSTQYLSETDLAAIGTYLLSLPGSRRTPPAALPALEPAMLNGRDLYKLHCAACHRSSGEGVPTMLPALALSPTVQAPEATSLIRTVLEGGAGAATDTNPTGARMPDFGWKLSNEEIAHVLTYVRNTWGNAASRVTSEEVEKVRAN